MCWRVRGGDLATACLPGRHLPDRLFASVHLRMAIENWEGVEGYGEKESAREPGRHWSSENVEYETESRRVKYSGVLLQSSIVLSGRTRPLVLLSRDSLKSALETDSQLTAKFRRPSNLRITSTRDDKEE